MIAQWDVSYLPLPDESIDMIFTDPPYVKEQVVIYKALAKEAFRVLKVGGFVAAMCGGQTLDLIFQWFGEAGLTFHWLYQIGLTGKRAGVVWKYGNQKVPISTRTKHVLVYSKGPSLPRTAMVGLYWAGGADKRWHHWGQDVDSHRYYIDCLTHEGNLVLDPMCGGGTTGVASSILDRRVLLGDLSFAACQTSAARMNGDPSTLSRDPLFAH